MVRLLGSIGRQSISIGIRVSELDSNNRLSPSSRSFCISFYSLLFSYSFPFLLVFRFSYPPMVPKFLATVSFTRFARAHTHEYDASSILHLHTFTSCSLFSFLPVQKIVLLLYFLLRVSCI